jgi:hypothetical protein
MPPRSLPLSLLIVMDFPRRQVSGRLQGTLKFGATANLIIEDLVAHQVIQSSFREPIEELHLCDKQRAMGGVQSKRAYTVESGPIGFGIDNHSVFTGLNFSGGRYAGNT